MTKKMVKPDDYSASFIANLVSDLFWNDDMDVKTMVVEMVTGKNEEQQDSMSEEEDVAADAVYDDLCQAMENGAQEIVNAWFKKYAGREFEYDSDAREPQG